MAAVAALAATGAAVAADDQRYDWNCSGEPRVACISPAGAHSWGSVTAVNQADPYPKCAALRHPGGEVARVCGYGYTVRANSNDRGYCPYPNNTTGGPYCGVLEARVGNDTSDHHGLRAVGYY
jgi:hypothetical protein